MMGQVRLLGDSFVEGQRLLLASQLAALRSEQEQADIAGLLVMAGAFMCLIAGIYIVVSGAGRLERTQQDLTARSRLLQTTLESLQDPIFVLDAAGTVVAWNRAFTQLAQWDPLKQAPPTRDQLLSDRSPAIRALLQPLGLGTTPADTASVDRSTVVRVSHDGRDFEVYRGEMEGGGDVIRCVDITEKLRDETALRQGRENGGDGPTHGRHGARLQQHPAGH